MYLVTPCERLCQVGMAEMKVCVQSTGGMVVQSDTFTSSTYKDSLKRLFLSDGDEGFMGLSSNATFEVRVMLLPL